MKITKYPKTLALMVIVVAAIAYSYSWTFTPHGRLDYRAAVSLHLLSFETTIKPNPKQDFELTLPVNMIYALSGMLPKVEVAKTQDVSIPGDGVQVPARVYWPKGSAPDTKPPLLLYYHGGGFVVGSVDIFDPLARSLADTTGAIVVSVDYRLAPASPYPAAVNDCYAALEWAAAQAEELGGDSSKLIVAGDSAGGNLAAVVALKAKNENGPALAAQILYYPVADLTDKPYASAEKFMDGYGLSSQSGAAFQKAYFGHVEDARDPYLSPLYAESLQNLPPVLLVTAGFDPLTDGAHAYADRLKEEGVAVTTRHYSSMIHGFMSIGLFSQQGDALEQTKTFLDSTL